MADEIRCPMCGEQNPADETFCQYCEARLKPLIASDPDYQTDTGKAPSESDSGLEELPTWLRGVGDERQQREPQRQEEAEELPDWLGEEAESPAPSTAAPDAGEGEEQGVWRSGLRAGKTSAASGQAAPEGEEGESTPDWLEQIRRRQAEEAAQERPPPEEEDDDGDFLERVRALKSSDEDLPGEPEEQAEDWLAELGGETPASEAEGETSEWLAGLGAETPSAGQAEAEESADWLSGPTGETAAAQEEQEPQDWLSGLGAESEGEAAPDWLPGAPEGGREPFLPPEETSDWQAGGESAPAFDEQADEEWLRGLQERQAQAAEAVEAEFPGLPEEPDEPGSALPQWLSEMEESTPEMSFDEGGVPPLVEPEEAAPFKAEGEGAEVEGLEEIELPDWVSQEAEGEAAEDLAPAELPGWLQAMRPSEAGPSAFAPQRVTGEEMTVGPLAGLRGVLPAEPEIVQFGGKPPAYSERLEVTQSQRAHAAMLEAMIAGEGEPVPLERAGTPLSQRILRWIIAGLLMLALLIPVLGGSQGVPLPARFVPEEIQSTRNLIDSLPTQTPVLVAFDYQPGLSGEMDAAAAAVIDHLLIHGAPLTLISTNPTGPALAERFLESTQSAHNAVAERSYVNLGYVSGGASALRSFATSPRATAPASREDGTNVWDVPPLQNVASVRDFALVLVITEEPDTARAWIEQVQPQLVDEPGQAAGTPMTMVIGAQAEPLVRPYYDSSPKQVSGFVTGVAGGAFYESLLGRGNLARTYWDAFGAGLTVSVLLIVLGSTYGLALQALPGRGTPWGKGRS